MTATEQSTEKPKASTPKSAPESPVLRQIAVPATWYLGAAGDPVAEFDYLQLRLHEDGSVTWVRDDPQS